MKRLMIFCVVIAVAMTAMAAETKKPLDKTKPKGSQRERTALMKAQSPPTRIVTYKKVGERELTLHIYEPAGFKATDKRPCFYTIHGGGWTGGDATVMDGYAERMAKRGWVAVSLEYRLYNPAKGIAVTDCVNDARSGMRFIRAHAAQWGIDPDRIVANGASAGGHLAAALALFDEVNDPADDLKLSTMPAAMVLFYPVIDTGPQGYGNAKAGPDWKKVSPVDRVHPGLPPTLVMHGTGDGTCPYAGARLFHEKMLAAGNRCELSTNDGGGHGYFVFDDKTFIEAMATMDAFLKSLGYPVDEVR